MLFEIALIKEIDVITKVFSCIEVVFTFSFREKIFFLMRIKRKQFSTKFVNFCTYIVFIPCMHVLIKSRCHILCICLSLWTKLKSQLILSGTSALPVPSCLSKGKFFFRKYYAACQIAKFSKHFTVPMYCVQEQ